MDGQMADERTNTAAEAAQVIAIDQRVYDARGDEVGTVAAFDRDAGWMTVERGMLVARDLYVPFSAIASANGQQIVLSLSRDDLERTFARPLVHTTVGETIPGPEGRMVAVTTEPSGYNGRPVVVARADVEEMGRRIAAGVAECARNGDAMQVYAVDGKHVGRITRYDAESAVILVERRVLVEHHTLSIPVTVVADVNLEAGEVYLAVTEADLQAYLVP